MTSMLCVVWIQYEPSVDNWSGCPRTFFSLFNRKEIYRIIFVRATGQNLDILLKDIT